MQAHLTDSYVSRIKTPDSRVELKDTRIPGFTLRVGKRAKVWYFRSTVRSERVSIKLGTWPVVNAEMARARCIHWLQHNRDTYTVDSGNAPSRAVNQPIPSPTLQEVYDQYIKAKQLRPASVATYSKTLRLYLSEYTTKPLTGFTSQLVRKLYAGLKNKISVAKANSAVTLLKAIWRWWGATQEIELPDVFTALTASGEKQRTRAKDDVLIDSQIKTIWDEAQRSNNEKYKFIQLGLFTGLRLSEILNLTPLNIDFEHKKIQISETKNGRSHSLPITSQLNTILKYLCLGKAKNTKLFSAHAKNWCSSISNDLSINFTTHTLRRTFASIAAKINLNSYQIRALLNHHANADVTQLHYVRLTTDDLAEPMQKINDYISNLHTTGNN